jgi:HlyD family secretion protein
MSKIGSTFSRLFSKKNRKWIIVAAAVLVVGGFFGYRHWRASKTRVPEGIAWGNGRLESKQVDVSSKLPLKVEEVVVAEGDLVRPGQIVVQMDTVTLEAELAEANENVAAAKEQLAVAKAAIARRTSEIALAKIEKERSKKLVQQRAGSQREYDVRTMMLETTTAGLAEEMAKLDVAEQQVAVAEASVATIQSRIDDATLRSPVLGRVLYRLAEPGEVLGAGGKALTLVNLEDVYIEIFLPSAQAAAVKLGAEARFTVDYEPDRVAVGWVSFVSPEAQFTPKEVETKSEREKLMFRVKIQVPRELVERHIERIKTGVRAVGYVKIDDGAAWPDWLQKNLIQPDELVQVAPSAPTDIPTFTR